ncbi:Uncharacterised protein [Streptococcus pneumoniae]|uniref:Uncharacterized protein n=1 Tax=Streptococcus pneumoniae TaxID=1313 RepID=A0A4J1WIA9_STREE|nr:Uncharacterised protein [Streptococcus pneumoniae]VIW03535.1 Uncharacterised protein [Streptococcus pneumoniae]VNP68052.1 Uncharacterised protein [Streptococcus pneumoniae]
MIWAQESQARQLEASHSAKNNPRKNLLGLFCIYFTRLAKLFLKSTFSVGLKSTLSPLVVDELKMIPAICIQSNLYIDP